jgi:hypothetical protein
LPDIEDIMWFEPIDPVLTNITAGLQSVTRFAGNISDVALLVQKCPNIKELSFLAIAVDISVLRELRCVSKLMIIQGSCAVMRFAEVLTPLGTTLTVLEMRGVLDINIRDVLVSCAVLESLNFSYCNITHSDTYDRGLAHFQNLKTLKLRGNRGTFDFSPVLHLYVNLNQFCAEDVREINDTFIWAVVAAGGFRHLTTFIVNRCGYMGMHTAWLLVQSCPNLVRIGHVYTWPFVTNNDVEEFLNFLRRNNLSLALYS